MTSTPAPLLKVSGLQVWTSTGVQLLHDISFTVAAGEYVGIVGPSGAGKSVLIRSLLGMPGPGLKMKAEQLTIMGEPMTNARPHAWRKLRRRKIGYIPQDALGSLDPLRPIGHAVTEVLPPAMPRAAQSQAAATAMAQAELDPGLLSAYPHQLSGGMRQRALIAAALVHDPALIIADEPTSALDATIGARVLTTLNRLRTPQRGMLMISHDLASLSRVVDRVIQVADGRLQEGGPIDPMVVNPLLAAPVAPPGAPAPVRESRAPEIAAPGLDAPELEAPELEAPELEAPELEAQGLRKQYFRGGHHVHALDGVALAFPAGQRLGIVGESGSGKSTLIRALLALEHPDQGQVRHRGGEWLGLGERRRREMRRRFALIPQDIAGSFNPRSTVGTVLRQAGAADDQQVQELLAQVELSPGVAQQRTQQLSGGMRQRVAIARALATGAQTLVCDEPFSALDPDVAAKLVQLLLQLSQTRGLGIIMVTHDLALVRALCEQVLVMQDGRVVEQGAVADIWQNPAHPHTQELVATYQPY